MATNDKLIKDLVIKIKAGDIATAAKHAEKLSDALENAAAGGDLVDESIQKLPATLRNAVDRANDLKKALTSKINSSLVGQFGTVNSELKSVTSQLQAINKLASGTISFKGLGTSSNQAAKLAENLLESTVAAELLEKQLEEVQYQLINATDYSEKLRTSMEDAASFGSFDRIDGQLSRLNDTLEMVLGELTQMGENMENSAELIIDSLEDINAGTELVRRTSKNTTEAVSGLGNALEKTGKQTDKANRALSNSGTHALGATREFSKLAKMGGSLSITYAIIAANVFAIKSAWDFVAKGDALMRMEKASNDLAATSGIVVNDMVKMIQEVSGFSVDYETAMRTAAAATVYGFDTDTIQNFTKIARGAAQVLGGDMTDLLNRLVKGTAKQERELLDELGIMVRVDKAQEDYAASIGKTVTQLTSLQKQQAFANAVAKNGIELYGSLGDTISNTTPIEKATAATSELVRRLSELLAIAVNPIVVQLVTKTEEAKAIDKVESSIQKVKDLAAQTDKQIKAGSSIQAVNLLNQALEEQVKLRQEGLDAQNALVDSSKKMKQLGEAGGLEDSLLRIMTRGTFVAPSDVKMQSSVKDYENINVQLKESEKLTSDLLDSTAKSLGVVPSVLKSVLGGFTQVNSQVVNSSKTAATLNGEINKGQTALKVSVTTSRTLAENFQQAKNEIAALEELLDNAAVKAVPKLADQIKATITKVLQGVGVESKSQLDQLQGVYADQAKFDREAAQRAKELAAANAKSLDSNVNSLSVNSANVKIAEQTLALAQARLAANQKDEEAANIVKEQQAQLINLAQERKETEYAIGQQNIDNASAIKEATIMLQDQTDATRARLMAENALAAAKAKTSSAGTAADSAAAINARAQAEVALKEAILEEASANDSIISKKKILAAYQKETEDYMRGHITHQSDIVTAEREYVDASTELERINKAGLKYEERRLELMQKQLESQRTISDLKAQDILSKIEEKQLGSSRNDTGPLSTAKRQMDEAEERMQALAKDANTFGSVSYKRAEEEYKQAKYEYEKSVAAKDRETTDTALGAFGTSQISSVKGLEGEDRESVLSADALANYTSALDTIASYNPAMTDMISNMGQLTNAFIAFGQGAVTASQLVAPVLNTIGSAMTASSQTAIDNIQSQIDMEKKLDGNSEKSKAKIAKLEAEKAAKEKKMAQQTIITQTAVGMAQALGSMPFPYNLVAMGTVAAAGLMALKQAQSATSIVTSTGTGTESLSLGERSNRVDTSIAATMGESAYIRGDQGVGSIQNFTPRASGGKAYAGTTILAGENGPEPITLGTDAVVTSNSSAKKQGVKPAVNVNINAVDARSFRDLLATDPAFITSLVEATLNERGGSLGY